MRYIAEIVSVMAGLSVMAKMTITYVQRKRARESLRTAFFSGGEMDGEERKLPDLPKLITHDDEVYRREHDDGRTALYIFTGAVQGDELNTLEVH